MENALEKAVSDMIEAGNAGALVADKNGLVLASAGTLKQAQDKQKYDEPDTAAIACQMLHLAGQLEPAASAPVEVVVVGDHTRLVLNKSDVITVTHANH